MRKILKKTVSALSAALVIAALLIPAVNVLAANATISLATENSTADVSGAVRVNVTISADSQIGTYYIELEYDSTRLTYVDGADSVANGIATLTGTALSDKVEYNINFTGAVGGEGGVSIRSARVNDTDGTPFDTTNTGVLSITVNGQSDNSPSFIQKLEEESEIMSSDLPLAGTIHDQEGNTYYVVDVTQTKPEGLDYDYEVTEVEFEGQTINCAADKGNVLNIVPLSDSGENVKLYAINGDVFYPLNSMKDADGQEYRYVTLDACSTMPQALATSSEMWDYVIYAVDTDGEGAFYLVDEKNNLVPWASILKSNTTAASGISSFFLNGTTAIPWEQYLKIAAIVLAAIIVLCIVLIIIKAIVRHNKRKRGELEETPKTKKTSDVRAREAGKSGQSVKSSEMVKQAVKSVEKPETVKKTVKREETSYDTAWSGKIEKKTPEISSVPGKAWEEDGLEKTVRIEGLKRSNTAADADSEVDAKLEKLFSEMDI